jgi:hypothetical protein
VAAGELAGVERDRGDLPLRGADLGLSDVLCEVGVTDAA